MIILGITSWNKTGKFNTAQLLYVYVYQTMYSMIQGPDVFNGPRILATKATIIALIESIPRFSLRLCLRCVTNNAAIIVIRKAINQIN